MSTPVRGAKLRAYLEFLAAIIFFLVARVVARQAAPGWVRDGWVPLVEQGTLALLLILGYTVFGRFIGGQKTFLVQQGFPLREGWLREARLGIATGWGLAIACVLPLTILGGIAVVLNLQSAAWGWWIVDLAFFALLAFVEEMAFRGYGFQRLERVVGPVGAAVVFGVLYMILQAGLPGSSLISYFVSGALATLLSVTYLRTRALWFSWGINFAWKASRALIFGLVISGVGNLSPVVQGEPMGRHWLTGGGYGLDGSWLALVVLLVAIPVVFHLTGELDFIHNAPVFIPGGIPVDIDAAARSQHEAAMGAAPAPPPLVQILPAAAPAASEPPLPPPQPKE
ncbi:MAG TPA: CPBP family intramembrane glutamic endopeptidase [Terracidiphilus sp.]